MIFYRQYSISFYGVVVSTCTFLLVGAVGLAVSHAGFPLTAPFHCGIHAQAVQWYGYVNTVGLGDVLIVVTVVVAMVGFGVVVNEGGGVPRTAPLYLGWRKHVGQFQGYVRWAVSAFDVDASDETGFEVTDTELTVGSGVSSVDVEFET